MFKVGITWKRTSARRPHAGQWDPRPDLGSGERSMTKVCGMDADSAPPGAGAGYNLGLLSAGLITAMVL